MNINNIKLMFHLAMLKLQFPVKSNVKTYYINVELFGTFYFSKRKEDVLKWIPRKVENFS